MATVNFTLTLDDAHLARFLAATRTRQNNQALTEAEIVEILRQNVMREMVSVTAQVEREAALRAAQEGVTLITIS